ncbi:Nif11-like leader peptide family natural product precursor [Nostoc commune]|uniref:Nif11-like leader peptide family natural product precursor n=1 Tax=Nostoc commune TaxID=1178 RepID=UPI001E39E079|nr:Nif11-like leader peptide family natural product precursor [Nostoc commune]MBG1261943.1 Nif11-like leader peptide family natural product precursor [Nostoc commune BAE]
MSLEHVKAFYGKLVNDEAFRNQIQGVSSKEECSQIVKAAGYDFTLEEYEEYTTQLLESAAGEGELKDLSEKELAAVFGGLTGRGSSILIYGAPDGLWNFRYLSTKPLLVSEF